MMSSHWITVSMVLSVIYLPVLYFGVGKLLQPLARKALMVLTVLELCLVFLHLIVYANNITGFWEWFLNLGSEYALGAMYSASQLLAVGLIAFVIARYASFFTPAQRLYWVLLALLFTALNLDEYYVLHDSIDEIIFAGLAVIGMGVILIGYWVNFRHDRKLFVLLFGGLFIMGLALVSDAILPNTPQQSALEEFMEMNGVTVVLVGFLSYANVNLSEKGYRRAKRIPLFTSILWFLFLGVMFWIVPAIENKLFAQPIHIEYLDGDLALVGYRLDQNRGEPGDTVDLTLYWEVKHPVPYNYGVSAHLLTHPDIKSVFQSDHLLVLYYQTASWIPDIVTRLSIKLQIPNDQPLPSSYWLQLTVWNTEEYAPINVTDYNDGWLLDAEDLILLGFPVLTNQSNDSELIETAYHFGDTFDLSGYSIPETVDDDDSLPLIFQWQTHDQAIQAQYTQFVHIFHDDEFITGFDTQPFGGRFPTSDWPTNVTFTDTLDIPLPEDLPDGDYDIFTGMYDNSNQQRLDIIDDGTPLPNGLAHLGTVHIE